jgi:hypothetical protein
MRKLSMLVAALVVAVVSLRASDVTGKWTAQVPGRDGQTRETTFTFKADGEKLTGTMTGMQGEVELKDGVIKGDDISFNTLINTPNGEIKLLFKGKVAGDEIKFTRQREGGEPREFTAKRVKAT